MIGTIDIEVNAAHPSMPLSELCAFVGSPSQVRIRNVPRGIGNWKLTAVYVAVAYPDNTVQAPSCVLTGGIWTATIPGSTATGMSGNGFQVLADGVDEHGSLHYDPKLAGLIEDNQDEYSALEGWDEA